MNYVYLSHLGKSEKEIVLGKFKYLVFFSSVAFPLEIK